MRKLLVASVLLTIAGLGSPSVKNAAAAQRGGPQTPPFKVIASNRLLGDAVHEPAAQLIWNAVGSRSTANGVEEIAPKTDEEWTRLRNGAVIISETANLLMLPPRAMDNGEWMKLSRALVDAGDLARQAAESKDPDKLLEAGGEIFTVCNDCHMKYEGAAVRTSPRANR